MLGMLDVVMMEIAKLLSKPIPLSIPPSPASVMLCATYMVTVVTTSLSLSALRKTVSEYLY